MRANFALIILLLSFLAVFVNFIFQKKKLICFDFLTITTDYKVLAGIFHNFHLLLNSFQSMFNLLCQTQGQWRFDVSEPKENKQIAQCLSYMDILWLMMKTSSAR